LYVNRGVAFKIIDELKKIVVIKWGKARIHDNKFKRKKEELG
jgi:hypothetical protein